MDKPAAIHTAITQDAWAPLRRVTGARIALGRAGSQIPLQEELKLRVSYARARDAVYTELNTSQLAETVAILGLPVLQLQSCAANRLTYLQQPGEGRRLNEASRKKILPGQNFDVCFIVADGLSATAVQLYTQPALHNLLACCVQAGFTAAPICIVEQGRVAIGDEIGMLLNASVSVVFIGERPGLSSPASMGIYITYAPHPGTTDESRYCISNIHTPAGLAPQVAAEQAFGLIQSCLKLKLSGVHAAKEKYYVLGKSVK